MKKLIEIENLTVSYDEEEVLRGVDLTIYENDFLGVIGPNGGGKTTLIKAFWGFLKPKQGKIKFHIPTSKIGYLPQ